MVGEFYMSYGGISWDTCDNPCICTVLLGKGHDMTRVLQLQRDIDRERERKREREREGEIKGDRQKT